MNALSRSSVVLAMIGLLVVLFIGLSGPVRAQDEPVAAAQSQSEEVAAVEADAAAEQAAPPAYATEADVDALWTCIAAFLVFFMQAGFAMVECGFTRAKNACNILMKNLMDFSIGALGFWAIGFALMFGATSGYIGLSGFFYNGENLFTAGGSDGSFGWAFLLFQTVFAATAATIVSGAMAERTKFHSYLLYSVGITLIVYPIFGSWCWNGLVENTGGGWLEGMGFYDFAGSTVVHSIGGWAALAGAIVLGARKGKYKNGKVMPIPGHNMPLAALGVFILWLGWFGFNPGSTTAVGGGNFAYIAVTTNLAAAAGAIGAMAVSWVLFKKPDPSFSLNGALAGLVAITAGCDAMAVPAAVLTGLVAGGIVVFSVVMLDRLRIDDPVGAVSVHGVCGAWGTLCVGLFMLPGHAGEGTAGLVYGGTQLGPQLIGVAAGFLWAFPVSLAIFYAIKMTVGLRVSEEEELEGLDVAEHGMYAYPPGFVTGEVVGTPVSAAAVSAAASTAKLAVPEGT